MSVKSGRPRFSIVTAVYNVAAYLPEFIASVEDQRIGPGDLEVIAVDDGSTDGSGDALRAWASRSRFQITVLSKPNGGQASARNLGLDHAEGEWVTFPDPDDRLDPNYFAIVGQFADRHPQLEILGTQLIVFEEARGAYRKHARAAQYADGDRAIDLRDQPNTFPGGTNICIFRRARVAEFELEFDTRLRPALEDVHFTARYLLELEAPVVGLVATAHYVYRRRASNDSTLQGGWSHPGRFREVPRYGHLDLLQRAKQRPGNVPEWLQHLVIYDLSWYFSEYEKADSAIRLAAEDTRTFEGLLREILLYLDADVVARHTSRPLKPIWDDVIGHAFRPDPWHSAPVRTRMDRVAGLQRVTYRYNSTRPRETISVDGNRVEPAYAKTMRHVYFGSDVLLERVLWLPADGRLRLQLDDDVHEIAPPPAAPALWGLPLPITRRLRRLARAGRLLGRTLGRGEFRRAGARVAGWALRTIAASWIYRRQFANAWVLMDRYRLAGDNGERLFEYLIERRPDINAWFVVDDTSADWARMRAAGHRRLVPYRSFRWKMLMLNAGWFVSSHADAWIVDPPEIRRIRRRRRWRYAFLQHGVTKDDLSIWLNPKNIDLLVTSTPDETLSIVDDNTCYIYTTKEVRETGMPRFDRLLALGRDVSPDERDVILICPTWRKWFTLPLQLATRRRQLSDALWESDYLRNWDAILRSNAVAEAARAHAKRVVFVPHPEFQPLLEEMSLPGHVEPFPHAGGDLQSLFARCALLITDYSSVAFDAAYLDRPVVYFQFDLAELRSGAHISRDGYFDYERDGFGPVVIDLPAAEQAIVAAIERGPRPSAEYQERIDMTYPARDGQACARVVAAIEELSRPYGAPTA